MSDNPCNCSTCTVPKNVTYPKWCPVIEEWIAPNYPEKIFILRKCGCLSRPGAREWLMKDVIEELERLSNQNVGSQYRYALTEAISLIRDGVKP
jgi:hypothetical protein